MRHAIPFVAMVLAGSAAAAQSMLPNLEQTSGSSSIGQLLADDYEIKSAVPNGNKFIVFMQKDKSAYACEFAKVARSRCESLN